MPRRKKKSSQSFVQDKLPTMSQPLIEMTAPIGVTNLGRRFDVDKRNNGPQLALMASYPTFARGWSSTDPDGISVGDTDAAINTLLGHKDPLYPITPQCETWKDEYWPLLYALLQSGVGTRTPVTMHEVVRYFSMVEQALQRILAPLAINYLATGFRWEEIVPFSSSKPPMIWGLVNIFDCTDIGIADTWRPYYQRIAEKVLPPGKTAQILDMAMPYLTDPSGHLMRLRMAPDAVSVIKGTVTLDQYLQTTDALLYYIENTLSDVHNVLASFLPHRVGPPMMTFKGYNAQFEEIDYNSPVNAYPVFEDTGDPLEHTVMCCGDGSGIGDTMIFYHRGGAPTAMSISKTPIFEKIYHMTDNTYMCLTAFNTGSIVVLDDNLNLIEYTATPAMSANAQRYSRYVNNRWLQREGDASLTEGCGRPGYLPALIQREEVVRAIRLYTNFTYGTETLKSVLAVTGGSSVRTIYKTVAEAWARGSR